MCWPFSNQEHDTRVKLMNAKTTKAAKDPLAVIKNADGSVTIPLNKPLKMEGTDVKALTMREPTVRDQRAARKLAKDDEEAELALMANLCLVSMEDLDGLTLRDFRRVQEQLLGFIA